MARVRNRMGSYQLRFVCRKFVQDKVRMHKVRICIKLVCIMFVCLSSCSERIVPRKVRKQTFVSEGSYQIRFIWAKVRNG